MHRTHHCNELRAAHIGQAVTLEGWVNRRRDLGSLIFIDVRDREGMTQIIIDPAASPEAHKAGGDVRPEWVLRVRGTVRSRGQQVNTHMATGEIEVLAAHVEVLSTCPTPPFPLDGDEESDDLRLQYRYLDLRRPRLREAMRARHLITQAVRTYLTAQGFWEIETPILTKSTPEGARDYLVPSRVHPGHFYALPQSPQLLKQLCMVSGLERYFQVCRCFRDEDLRADRQPEFTQIDIEMSFASQDDVFAVTEGVITAAFAAWGREAGAPFARLSYQAAMETYGTDKPDLRYELPQVDVTDAVRGCAFQAFKTVCEEGGRVKAMRVPGGATLSRREVDELGKAAAALGAKGVLAAKFLPTGEKQSPLAKSLTDAEWQAITAATGAEAGDCVLFVADKAPLVHQALGAVRTSVAERLGLAKPGTYAFAWITDFPLFSFDKEENRWVSEHHPFTAPHEEDLAFLESDPGRVRSSSYDLVVNGIELASGSVRIHRRDVQERVFKILRLTPEETQERFGFFLDALQYGAPPHAGIAPGLDRLVMLILGRSSLRDVIAFPKTQKAADLLSGAPSPVRAAQLDELHISITKE
ncbi:aspartate--tRNA ligase [bacterium]|nr:aspartate--tRNA ligase [bacterium]